MMSAYPGIGTIYVALAQDPVNNGYSIYVPTYTYACLPITDGGCNLMGKFYEISLH